MAAEIMESAGVDADVDTEDPDVGVQASPDTEVRVATLNALLQAEHQRRTHGRRV